MTHKISRVLLRTISAADITQKIFSALEASDLLTRRPALKSSLNGGQNGAACVIQYPQSNPSSFCETDTNAHQVESNFPVDWSPCKNWRALLPELPMRPPQFKVVDPDKTPKRFSPKDPEGASMLLHALAQIELSAIEIDCAFLFLYPSAPESWKRDMAQIIRDECRHFTLISQKLIEWQRPFGFYAIHFSLWNGFMKGASWLEHLALATRYQEANGVDASFHLQQIARESPAQTRINKVLPLIETLHSDEIEHVAIGSKWWNWAFEHGHVALQNRRKCEESSDYFFAIIEKSIRKPWSNRFPFYLEGRQQAGFNSHELKRFAGLNQLKISKPSLKLDTATEKVAQPTQ